MRLVDSLASLCLVNIVPVQSRDWLSMGESPSLMTIAESVRWVLLRYGRPLLNSYLVISLLSFFILAPAVKCL